MFGSNTVYHFFIFATLLFGGPLVHAQNLKMLWKDSAGSENNSVVRAVTADADGRQLIFLAFESPFVGAQTAGYLEEGVSDETSLEEIPSIPVKARGGKKYLLLWHKAGKVKVVNEDGSTVLFTYELNPTKSSLQLSPSCRKFQFKVKTVSQDTASFPAMIHCTVKNGLVEEVTFSTLAEADWFGSAAFENAGKGERWKSYIYKDISTLGIWEMSWGDPDAKAVGKVLIPKPEKKTPVQPKPTLIFMVGLQYLSGKASKAATEGDIAGMQVPLSVQYQKDGAWWYLGSGYEFFVLSTTQSSAGSNSLSNLGAWAGAEAKFTNFSLRGSLGFSSRALTVPDIGVTSTFEAPRLGAELHRITPTSLTGLEVAMAQTSTEGTFEEMTATLFYQTKLLFGKETRFQFVNTNMKASSKNMDIEANWMSLGLALQF